MMVHDFNSFQSKRKTSMNDDSMKINAILIAATLKAKKIHAIAIEEINDVIRVPCLAIKVGCGQTHR